MVSCVLLVYLLIMGSIDASSSTRFSINSPRILSSTEMKESLSTLNHLSSQKGPPSSINSQDEERISEDNERSIWEIIWEAHIYFSGTLFVLLALYCSVNLLRIHAFSTLFSRGYFVALNLCLLSVGILRPILLLHDPYNESGNWIRLGAYLLMDTPFPCITTSFAVLFLALLRTTQIELVSPTFQTPKALGIFCGVHFLLSFTVDITIGLLFSLRYLVLLCQGFFIVWSLLLSAGFFYIFSPMNKMAMRIYGDYTCSVYPKMMLDGEITVSSHTPYSLDRMDHFERFERMNVSQFSATKKPLVRVIHLTLGVAVLGSVMGGLQLFAMIKMLGLFKDDMSSDQNEWAWYGYQVSMRILEIIMCSLLAIIATSLLTSEPKNSCHISGMNSSQFLKAPNFCCHLKQAEPEDEIYSEICSNNQSVRQVRQDNNLHLGTLNGPLTTTPVLFNNIQTNTTAHPIGTVGRSSGVYQEFARTSGAYRSGSAASSSATLDTALYSNIRSRTSSMLLNESGFIRIHQGSLIQDDFSNQPTSNFEIHKTNNKSRKKTTTKEQLGALQSFDEKVLLMDGNAQNGPFQTSPIYKSIDSDSEEQELTGMEVLPKQQQQQQQIPDSSDMDSIYSHNVTYNRASSVCSSISATQSFDLQMYGHKPSLQKNEEPNAKLDNPYYYYGSTRNQKKVCQKPRPLLPSQRLELQPAVRSSSFRCHSHSLRPNYGIKRLCSQDTNETRFNKTNGKWQQYNPPKRFHPDNEPYEFPYQANPIQKNQERRAATAALSRKGSSRENAAAIPTSTNNSREFDEILRKIHSENPTEFHLLTDVSPSDHTRDQNRKHVKKIFMEKEYLQLRHSPVEEMSLVSPKLSYSEEEEEEEAEADSDSEDKQDQTSQTKNNQKMHFEDSTIDANAKVLEEVCKEIQQTLETH